MKRDNRNRVSKLHRLAGLALLVPLTSWIVSSFVLHGVVMFLPESGLAGEYELADVNPGGAVLEDPELLPPDSIMSRLRSEGLERIYWLRLESLGSVPAWIVKPGPFDLERTYDARTGERLDPLRDSLLRSIGDVELTGTRVAEVGDGSEFNRYYTMDRVPAAALRMEGDQPSELVVTRASGRTLRRTDPLAEAFSQAYRWLHIWQWGDAIRVFTTLLFAAAGIGLVTVLLGYVLWFDRRERRKRWTESVRSERRLHARLAPVAGIILATQMLVGAYLWYNLGLIEPRFRGQGSFRTEWVGGISTSEALAPQADIASALTGAGIELEGSIQRYEWRAIDDERFWLAYPRRDRNGHLLDARTGDPLEELTEDQARRAGEMVVNGPAEGAGVEADEYWMDFNTRVPTWRFRFSDPDATDVHVSKVTGEVVQRRPAIWRVFGPFLAYHTFGFTGNKWLDTLLLTAMQAVLIAMMVSGWRLSRRRRERTNGAAHVHEDTLR